MLGEIPVDPEVVRLADERDLGAVSEKKDTEIYRAYEEIIGKI
jgi:hypothetical protein